MHEITIFCRYCWFSLFLLMAACLPATGKVIYVDDAATGANNGSNWQNAYIYLQDALTDAQTAPKPVEIRVAQGTYKPDRGRGITIGNREVSFQLIDDVNIIGGYAGLNQPDPNVRDIELYQTILSGDLNGNDADLNDINDLLTEPTRAENSYNVLTINGTTITTFIDGIIIIGGFANYYAPFHSSHFSGGGIYIQYGNLTITNCTLKENSANRGGAIYNFEGSLIISNTIFDNNLTFSFLFGDVGFAGTGSGIYNYNSNTKLENCTFTHNSTTEGCGGGIFNGKGNHEIINCTFNKNYAVFGPAVYNHSVTYITLTDCLFTENSGDLEGAVSNVLSTTLMMRCKFISNMGLSTGAVYNEHSTYIVKDSIFTMNLGYYGTGGVYNYGSNTTIENCIFTGNQVLRQNGGAIETLRGTTILTNCTITCNRASQAGGGICNVLGGNSILRNCIIWGNTAPVGSQIAIKETSTGAEPSTMSVYYSTVMYGPEAVYVGACCSCNWEDGNFDTDPFFADPNKGDYHLKSQAGRWDPNSQSWIIDNVQSPCIDAGDPNSPIGYEPNSTRINMGAYGGTIEASKSLNNDVNYFQQSSNPNPVDGTVDVLLDTTLSWTSDTNAVAHEVYFGKSELPPFVQKCYQTKFDPRVLKPYTQYYWRIDEVDSLLHRVVGNIWTFTTTDSFVQAYHPYPADGAVEVNPYNALTISWESGLNAVAHDVYFGTDSNKVNAASIANPLGVLISAGQDQNSLNLGTLQSNLTYYWRIDEIDSNGVTTTGNVWVFNTQQEAGKGPMCFIGSTPVWIDDRVIAISTAKIGQNTGENSKIEQVQEHDGTFTLYDVLLDSGNCITVAENHYFMNESGKWTSLHDLCAGMRLKTSKSSIGIKSITKQLKPYTGKVYNLQIQGSDQYMVGEDAVIVRDY
jgi:hypothetical protein